MQIAWGVVPNAYAETVLTSQQLAGLLGETNRRRVVASLLLRSGDAQDIVSSTGLKLREVVEALVRLEQSGLVIAGDDGTYVIIEELFSLAARNEAVAPADDQHGDQPNEHQAVLNTALVDGRIVQWPTKRTKRLIVLERLAQEFEPGRRFSEREVNTILRTFHDDVAMLRRWLFDESFLDRADGEYWRMGGRIDT